MKIEKLEDSIPLPAGVTAAFTEQTLRVDGPKGSLSRVLFSQKVAVTVDGGAIRFAVANATLREKKVFYTFKAHAKNLVRGVTEGYTYTLKVCSGHFPMSVSVKGRHFEIKNFIGEKVPRTLTIKEGAEVKVDGDKVVVTGIDKELVSHVAAEIEQLSRRPGFDTRIFQDGIFIIDKAGKQV